MSSKRLPAGAFKVYAHIGDRCVILKWPSRAAARAATPSDAADRFCAAYRRRYGDKDAATGEKAIDPAAVVFSAAPDTFSKGDDITVTLDAAAAAAAKPAVKPAAKPAAQPAKSATTPKPKPKPKPKPAPSKPLAAGAPLAQGVLRPLLHAANQAFDAKQYRRARVAFEQIVGIDSACNDAYFGLARVAAANDKHLDVIDITVGSLCEPARRPPEVGDLTTFGRATGDAAYLELLGDALFGAQILRSALRAYDECVQARRSRRRTRARSKWPACSTRAGRSARRSQSYKTSSSGARTIRRR